MLNASLAALFDAEPRAFAAPQQVTFRSDAATARIADVVAALSQRHGPPGADARPDEPLRFAFLLSRFDFDDHRYGHVPRLALYASILLDCFPDAEIAFVVTGALKNARRRWDDPDNLLLSEDWIAGSAGALPVYPLGGLLPPEKADRVRFFTPRGIDGINTLADAYAAALDDLFAFRPSHVFCPGGFYYPPPAADVLFAFFPIIRFAFKPSNRFSARCDAVLENTPLDHPPLGPARRVAVNLVGALRIASARGLAVPPDVPADAVVALTAITGPRLTASLADAPEAWIEGMEAALTRYPSFHWLLVGEKSSADRPAPDRRLAPFVEDGRVRILPFTPGLDALFERSAFLIQPYGQTGGGTAILLAMQRGLPVVSFSDHDMSGNIGAGRGQATIESGLAALDLYLSDPCARRRAGSGARAEFDALSLRARAETQKFRTLIDIASRAFAARRAGAAGSGTG